MKCFICEKEIEGDYHRFICEIPGIDEVLYTHKGICHDKFCGIEKEDIITNRFELLDL